MIRIAQIGCGMHGHEAHGAPLARFVAAHPGRVELVAACDLDTARAVEFCQTYGFARPYTNVDEMLASERIDACHCIVPPSVGVALVVKLLQRKIPCIVEKPMGNTPAQLKQLVDAAHETGTPHMVSVNRRFMPHLNLGLQWAREQSPIQYIRAALLRYNRLAPDFGFGTGIHAVDAIRHIMGDVESYSHQMQSGSPLKCPWNELDFAFKSGAKGRLDILPSTGIEQETYELYGEMYYVRIVSYMRRGTSVTCFLKNQEVVNENSEGQPQDVYRGEYAEVEEFVSAMEAGRAPRPSIDDIAPSMNICFSMQAAASPVA